ncbi:MAG TPA: hypothetical protein VK157_03250 [Phycisphaerales bacterium]|nr:hypothetical protein [Phycisphaerales bacterium]
MRTRLALTTLTLLALTLSGCSRGFWITNVSKQPVEMTTTNDKTGDRTIVTLQPGETRAFGSGPLDLGTLLVHPR